MGTLQSGGARGPSSFLFGTRLPISKDVPKICRRSGRKHNLRQMAKAVGVRYDQGTNEVMGCGAGLPLLNRPARAAMEWDRLTPRPPLRSGTGSGLKDGEEIMETMLRRILSSAVVAGWVAASPAVAATAVERPIDHGAGTFEDHMKTLVETKGTPSVRFSHASTLRPEGNDLVGADSPLSYRGSGGGNHSGAQGSRDGKGDKNGKGDDKDSGSGNGGEQSDRVAGLGGEWHTDRPRSGLEPPHADWTLASWEAGCSA